MEPYINLRYSPDPDSDVVVTHRIEAKDVVSASGHLAAESSVGTWTKVHTMKPRIGKLGAKVFRIDKKKKIIKVAYPLELFEENNIPQLLSDIAGNIFGMSEIQKLKLLDFELPRAYVKSFKGPAFGIEGVRKIIGTERSRRPHVGTIVKPKVGLNPQETADVAYEAWVGGIDFVKDDENLTSQKFCPFEERVIRVLEARDRAQNETGEKKMYAANITAETNEMLRRAEFVGEHGGNCIMVDIITAGFAGLQSVREAEFGMAIHAHRAMYAALARDERMGISMLALGKLARLAGVDQLHIGAIFGKMHGNASEVLEIKDAVEREWFGMRPVFSVASGGLSPLEIANVIRAMGKNVIIQAGGGVHGHPDGTRAGARAMRQAVEAAVKGINIREYARTHKELARALEKWGGKEKKYYAD